MAHVHQLLSLCVSWWSCSLGCITCVLIRCVELFLIRCWFTPCATSMLMCWLHAIMYDLCMHLRVSVSLTWWFDLQLMWTELSLLHSAVCCDHGIMRVLVWVSLIALFYGVCAPRIRYACWFAAWSLLRSLCLPIVFLVPPGFSKREFSRYRVLYFYGCVFLQYVVFVLIAINQIVHFGAVAKPPLHKPPLVCARYLSHSRFCPRILPWCPGREVRMGELGRPTRAASELSKGRDPPGGKGSV